MHESMQTSLLMKMLFHELLQLAIIVIMLMLQSKVFLKYVSLFLQCHHLP